MEPDVVCVVRNGLIKVALKQLIKTFTKNKTTVFREDLDACENGSICPQFLLIETNVIPSPADLSLARINSKNPAGKILLLENKPCLQDLSLYISDKVCVNDTEEVINEKFILFFNPEDNNNTASEEIISEREKEIVRLVALGKTNKEISDTLFISPHTVITHRKNITSKLGIKTIAGLTVYAVLNGLIIPDEVSK